MEALELLEFHFGDFFREDFRAEGGACISTEARGLAPTYPQRQMGLATPTPKDIVCLSTTTRIMKPVTQLRKVVSRGSYQWTLETATSPFGSIMKTNPRALLSVMFRLFPLLILCWLCVVGVSDLFGNGAPSKREFRNESQYVVATILKDLAEQVFYAKAGREPDAREFSVRCVEKKESVPRSPSYVATIMFETNKPALQWDIKIDEPIWSPALYKTMLVEVAKYAGLEASASNEPLDEMALLKSLTDLTSVTIERENQALSTAMSRNFKNSFLHEKAALLLGVLALKDNAGDFYDSRPLMCRVAAHLAMSKQFSSDKPYGINGLVAEAILYTLMNNQVSALDKIEKLPQSDPVVQKWVRSLRAFATSDYRALAKHQNKSPIERFAWFQAICKAADDDTAWSALSADEKNSPDFLRIAEDIGYTVEAGHEVLKNSIPAQFKEIKSVFELSSGRKLEPRELVSHLNVMPERCFDSPSNVAPKLHVIGWGQWAMFFQRHLCQSVQREFKFLNKMWGVPDEAQKFAFGMDRSLGSLRLYPFVRVGIATVKGTYIRAVDDAVKVTTESPHFVPSRTWGAMIEEVPFARDESPDSDECLAWFKPAFPPGTAYDSRQRLMLFELNHSDEFRLPPPSVMRERYPTLRAGSERVRVEHQLEVDDFFQRLDALHKLAPYDRQISFKIYSMKYKKTPTTQQAEELYGSVLPFATYAMTRVADTVKDQPDRYEKLMTNAAALNPVYFFKLGEYFLGRNEDDKTAEYYKKGEERCADAVKSSYYAPWRIQYYLKKGQMEQARRVADAAADVYSQVGLEAKAQFLEATGKYQDAFDLYVTIEERYNCSGPLVLFCDRVKTKTGDSKFDVESHRRIANLFTNGIEKVSIKDFQSPPVDGVLVGNENSLLRNAGLNAGDVIVAVYGIRVRSFKQYNFARDTSNNPEMTLIAWHGGRYVEVKASPPNHRFGLDFLDYLKP